MRYSTRTLATATNRPKPLQFLTLQWCISAKLLKRLARPTRFERVASTFGGWRSIQLSYGRIKVKIPFETDRGQPQTSSYSKNNPDRNKCSADCHRSLSTTSCVLLPRCFRETKCVSVNSEQISQPIDFTAIFLFRCSAKIACICLRRAALYPTELRVPGQAARSGRRDAFHSRCRPWHQHSHEPRQIVRCSTGPSRRLDRSALPTGQPPTGAMGWRAARGWRAAAGVPALAIGRNSSIRRSIWALRLDAVSPPITTATTLRPPRLAEVARL